MSEPQVLTLDNCAIVYEYEDGSVTVFSYTGKPQDVISQLMGRYLLPPKRYLEHPYHPDQPWWGKAAS